jgi:TatA/E family protein of Tat protein translocase
MLGFRELVIILLIVLVVFGTKRLISAGGDLGKAIQKASAKDKPELQAVS